MNRSSRWPRATGYVAGHGVAQFIDVGSGLPASPAVHEIVGLASPDARVAYVDNDPVVISHTAALLARPGRVAAVPGDVRRPRDILASPGLAALIDTGEPFCVILATILDFFEPAQAAGIAAAFRRAMPAGSFPDRVHRRQQRPPAWPRTGLRPTAPPRCTFTAVSRSPATSWAWNSWSRA